MTNNVIEGFVKFQ